MKSLRNNRFIFLFFFLLLFFYRPFFLYGKIPISADSLVGLYHPWRDLLSNEYPNGYPYKNPLITDPIRQQYPYRWLAITQLKEGTLPLWNSYSFSGVPLLANIQTAALYPLNFLFWLTSFESAWSYLVMLQQVIAFLGMYFYLKQLGVKNAAAFIGGVSFVFGGFMMMWLQWNTIGHVAAWLPWILLSIDKLLIRFQIRWVLTVTFAVVSSALAGHLQTLFYIFIVCGIHVLLKVILPKKNIHFHMPASRNILVTSLVICMGILVISFQYVPTFQFIQLSAREFDLSDWHRDDWFLPPKHLVQFLAPDFFGNPATGNYTGVWNYGEFTGYIGLIPLIFALFALCLRRDSLTYANAALLVLALAFALPTPIAQLPYTLAIPLVKTLQPSRILVLVDFSLSILAALGLDLFIRNFSSKFNGWKILLTLVAATGCILVLLWIGSSPGSVSRRNLLLPFTLTAALGGYLVVIRLIKSQTFFKWATMGIICLSLADMYRFGTKFTPFSSKELLYPQTKTLEYLKTNIGTSRFMPTDRRLLPPNVSGYYKLASVDGYDPVYLKNYGEFAAAWTRNQPDITPATFNRIITPENIDSPLTNLLGVKYIVSLDPLRAAHLRPVFTEGLTTVYENTKALPKAFLAETVKVVANQQLVMDELFVQPLDKVAITDFPINEYSVPLSKNETVTIANYSENEISLITNTDIVRMVVISDIFYPSWRLTVDGNPRGIIQVDYLLRGVIVPAGEHEITLTAGIY